MRIRKADIKDTEKIEKVYAAARQFMADNGNATQWGPTYPEISIIKKDIQDGVLYVIEGDGEIHGVFAFIIGEDPTYKVIKNGSWMSDAPYGTIHRLASDGAVNNIMVNTVAFCRSKINHLRIDTHKNNKVMQHLIKKCGFTECGIIYTVDTTERLAYEIL